MKTEFTVQETILSLPIPARYSLIKPTNGEAPKQLIILLHGYMERAERILRLLKEAMPEDAAVLVPNGPFPLPIQTEQGFKEAYGWYFFDVKTQTMLISPEPAVKMIKDLVDTLGLAKLPIRLVGFSQGGFFAPYLAARFPQVRHVISLAAGFPPRYFGKQADFHLDAVHGILDEVCPFHVAEREHGELTAAGWRGEFISLKDVAHRIEPAMRDEVARLLKLPLPERKSAS